MQREELNVLSARAPRQLSRGNESRLGHGLAGQSRL